MTGLQLCSLLAFPTAFGFGILDGGLQLHDSLLVEAEGEEERLLLIEAEERQRASHEYLRRPVRRPGAVGPRRL